MEDELDLTMKPKEDNWLLGFLVIILIIFVGFVASYYSMTEGWDRILPKDKNVKAVDVVEEIPPVVEIVEEEPIQVKKTIVIKPFRQSVNEIINKSMENKSEYFFISPVNATKGHAIRYDTIPLYNLTSEFNVECERLQGKMYCEKEKMTPLENVMIRLRGICKDIGEKVKCWLLITPYP